MLLKGVEYLMADIYKLTKLTNKGVSLLVSNAFDVAVDWVDPTTTPPTPGSLICQVDQTISTDPGDLETAINTCLTGAGFSTIDFTL
jgi:hypothetical protein